MLNLLVCGWMPRASGEPDWQAVLSPPGTHLHLYGKTLALAARWATWNITGS
jgi:5-(carboxyamino)imidazole ribonucleotide synthase